MVTVGLEGRFGFLVFFVLMVVIRCLYFKFLIRSVERYRVIVIGILFIRIYRLVFIFLRFTIYLVIWELLLFLGGYYVSVMLLREILNICNVFGGLGIFVGR